MYWSRSRGFCISSKRKTMIVHNWNSSFDHSSCNPDTALYMLPPTCQTNKKLNSEFISIGSTVRTEHFILKLPLFPSQSTFQHVSVLPRLVFSVSRIGTEFTLTEFTCVFKSILKMNCFAVVFSICFLIKRLGAYWTLIAISCSHNKLVEIIRGGEI